MQGKLPTGDRTSASDAALGTGKNAADADAPLGGLAFIAFYKLVKAVIAVGGAILVAQLGHSNTVHEAHKWLARLGLDPEGRLGTLVLAKLADLDLSRVHLLVGILLTYTALYCVEAVGLIWEKRWAEWLTIIQTMILVPVEIYEILRHPGLLKVLALLLSLGVVVYLVWRIQRDDRLRA